MEGRIKSIVDNWITTEEYLKNQLNKLNKREDKKMETKSRYEVIADLEEKKRDLIRERDSFKEQVEQKKIVIKNVKRSLEDSEEELVNFEATIEERKETIQELIKGIEESLQRFGKLQTKK